MRLLIPVLALLALLGASPVHAQTRVVADCASTGISWAVGSNGQAYAIGTDGKLCVNAAVNASISGFMPSTVGTPLAVTTTSATGTLPAGSVVVLSNVGSNAAYCRLSSPSTTAWQPIAVNSWFPFTVGGNTQYSCITSSGTTTVNAVGGSGLPTGSGGGGTGGGGGGAITAASGSYASGAMSAGSYAAGALSAGAFATGAGVDGWDLTQGAQANTVCATDTGTCSVISLLKRIAQGNTTIATNVQSSVPAGSNTIGGTTDAPFNTAGTDCSFSTNSSANTAQAVSTLTANSSRKKIALKVEGATNVCFNRTGGTAAAGTAGTFCLKGATTANAGDGGSWTTPVGFTDSAAWSSISTTASVYIYCTWQ